MEFLKNIDKTKPLHISRLSVYQSNIFFRMPTNTVYTKILEL